MSKARANIINALHALENGKSSEEVRAWLQDAINELQPIGRSNGLALIEGYTVTQHGNLMSVRDTDGEEFARCVQYPDRVTVHMRDRKYPVDVKTIGAAIDYVKLVVNLK